MAHSFKNKHGYTRVHWFLKNLEGVAPDLLIIAAAATGHKDLALLAELIIKTPNLKKHHKIKA